MRRSLLGCTRFGCEAELVGTAEVWFARTGSPAPDDRHRLEYAASAGGPVSWARDPRRLWLSDETSEPRVLLAEVDDDMELRTSGETIDLDHTGRLRGESQELEVGRLAVDLDFGPLGITVAIDVAPDGTLAGEVRRGDEVLGRFDLHRAQIDWSCE